MSTLYERMPQAKHAWDHIESLLQGLGIEELSSVESAVSRLANVFEQQGFTNGFRLGMMLREELIR